MFFNMCAYILKSLAYLIPYPTDILLLIGDYLFIDLDVDGSMYGKPEPSITTVIMLYYHIVR